MMTGIVQKIQKIVNTINDLRSEFSSDKSSDKSNDTQDTLRHSKSSSVKPINNQFMKILKLAEFLPDKARSPILTAAFSRMVPYVGTSGVFYETVTPNKVVVRLDNEKGVQNHIGTVHAVAVTLLAETATGFILGINLPADRVLLVKSYHVNFYRPLSKGQIAATATLNDQQRQYIIDTPKGDMIIPCTIEDRSSNNDRDPITVEMTWAWVSKSELKARQSNLPSENG